MQVNRMDISRIGPVSGCASSAVFVVCWAVSASLWGDWTLGTHALSDIGVCGIDSAEVVFNMGCLLTGFLVVLPGMHLADQENRMFRISGCSALVCSVACAAIGVVTEDYGDMHVIVTSIYAVFAAVFMTASAAGDYTIGRRSFTVIAAVLLSVSGIAALTQPFAVFEPIAVSCILLWTFLQSALMLHLDSSGK